MVEGHIGHGVIKNARNVGRKANSKEKEHRKEDRIKV